MTNISWYYGRHVEGKESRLSTHLPRHHWIVVPEDISASTSVTLVSGPGWEENSRLVHIFAWTWRRDPGTSRTVTTILVRTVCKWVPIHIPHRNRPFGPERPTCLFVSYESLQSPSHGKPYRTVRSLRKPSGPRRHSFYDLHPLNIPVGVFLI